MIDSTAGDRDAKLRTLTRLGGHRYPAARLMDDLTGDKKTDTGPLGRFG
jgi:hypothetical protein